MRLLVLGGGGFLGWHLVRAGLDGGHEVTTFSRSDPGHPSEVEALVGDRSGDLAPLEDRAWDAVVDTIGDADAVRRSTAVLADRVGVYGFVSGMSVYHPVGPAIPDESAPVRREGSPWCDDVLQERSVVKLAGEAAVVRAFGAHRTLIGRVGIMIGPRDPTDRFTYWPVRLARAAQAGEAAIVAPGDPRRPVQYTDARDIAAWFVERLVASAGGCFNLVGPNRDEPLSDVLAACAEAVGAGGVERRFVSEPLLRRVLADVMEMHLEQACADCGERDQAVLEYDHPDDDVFTLGAPLTVTPWPSAPEKREVVCGNCHRRRVAKRSGALA